MGTTPATDLRGLLTGTTVFGHLKGRELDALLEEMAWFLLPGGAPLYERGEDSDSLFLLKSGSLGLFGTPLIGGPPRLLGIIPAGETVGEIGLIAGETRTHSVRALRDSELLRLSRDGFDKLVARHPQAMLGAARVAVRRLLRDPHDETTSSPRTFAVLPFDHDVDLHRFSEALQHKLLAWGDCLVIDASLGQTRATDWFTERESEHRFVLYLGDGDPSWRRLCQRQADALLLVVGAERTAQDWPYPIGNPLRTSGRDPPGHDDAVDSTHHRPRHLILHHPPGKFIYGAARAWRARLGSAELQHHHWRHDGDVSRIARLLSGNGTGLVLSGGGARGFAQIGVVQALRGTGISVDTVVGTSIGAIIGAGIAYEWDDGKLRAACRRALVDGKPLGDWTLPLIALTRGARTTMLLREAFGEIDIEDLPIPFACVSADLTLGVTAVHREGRLWRWLRASSAVPGILPPLFHDQHVYVDGAVINNLPTDVLAEDAPGRLIAVDIGADDTLRAEIDESASPPWPTLWAQRRTHPRRPGAFAILIRAGMVNSESGSARRRELADLVLRPDMHEVGMFDWQKFDRAIEIGYRTTRDAVREPAAGTAKE
ncbi:MAG TPA: patatin-like phospholipase family protein [Rhodanobacteraceae bacterium]|jgi:NTE family protein|nr:patatin-like phospholipase family protein [Rhodanobacteraceae bacterium]